MPAMRPTTSFTSAPFSTLRDSRYIPEEPRAPRPVPVRVPSEEHARRLIHSAEERPSEETMRHADDDTAAFFAPGKSGRWWKKCGVVLVTGALLIAGSSLVCFNLIQSKGDLNYSPIESAGDYDNTNTSESALDSNEHLVKGALKSQGDSISVDNQSSKSALDEQLISALIKGGLKSEGDSISVDNESSKSALEEQLISAFKGGLKSEGDSISVDNESSKSALDEQLISVLIKGALRSKGGLISVNNNSAKSALNEQLISLLIKSALKSEGDSISVANESLKSALDEQLISILIKRALKSKGGSISVDNNSSKSTLNELIKDSKSLGDSINAEKNNKQLNSSIKRASISKAYSIKSVNNKTLIKSALTSKANYDEGAKTGDLNSTLIESVFVNNSYSMLSPNRSNPVSFIRGGGFETHPQPPPDEGLIENGIYWGATIEKLLRSDDETRHKNWSSYVETEAVGVKLTKGCGRMQNRMVTFSDGGRACVRYRQNTDQIQGELFSFYLARALDMAPNLAPSAASVIDSRRPLWRLLGAEMAAARWSPNKPVVLTSYIGQLRPAGIPEAFRPVEKHLNKFDLTDKSLESLLELAQWSDLIVFDYLTANLDRVVNNLYNYQWNSNIMDAPAHNLAKRAASDRLVFLDNESGLLHGYRLLDKYEAYHSIMLENLCVFRKGTARRLENLKRERNVGSILRRMFDESNSVKVKEALPALPDKSVKILNDRIDRVWQQIVKCESIYSNG